MMNKMIVSNLTHRPVRSAISILAIALEVSLILLIVGFALGMLQDSRSRQAGIGADVIVLPPASSNIIGLSDAAIPVKIADVLLKLPHVSVVSPVILKVSAAGALQTLWGIDLQTFDALRPFVYLKGGPLRGPDDILVDDIYTNGKHVALGDPVELFGHTFHVAGIVAHGKGARLFVPLATLQDLSGRPGMASAWLQVGAVGPQALPPLVSEVTVELPVDERHDGHGDQAPKGGDGHILLGVPLVPLRAQECRAGVAADGGREPPFD